MAEKRTSFIIGDTVRFRFITRIDDVLTDLYDPTLTIQDPTGAHNELSGDPEETGMITFLFVSSVAGKHYWRLFGAPESSSYPVAREGYIYITSSALDEPEPGGGG